MGSFLIQATMPMKCASPRLTMQNTITILAPCEVLVRAACPLQLDDVEVELKKGDTLRLLVHAQP